MRGGGAEEHVSDILVQIAVVALPLLVAVVLHEVAHGVVAYALGDPTAMDAGRLTLNPIRHLDPVGSVLLPGFLLLTSAIVGTRGFVFGWAKPVPVDFTRLRRPRRDAIFVALAGPGTNLLLATASAFGLAALPDTAGMEIVARLLAQSVIVNCVLAVFNLLPVPPLDGSRVVLSLLPARAARMFYRLERVGMLIVLLLVLNTNILPILVAPVFRFIVGVAR
jgi:Zn-dependent protease